MGRRWGLRAGLAVQASGEGTVPWLEGARPALGTPNGTQLQAPRLRRRGHSAAADPVWHQNTSPFTFGLAACEGLGKSA